MKEKKIYICEINQETNSFNATRSTFKNYIIKEKDAFAKDENNSRLKGILKAMKEENMSPVFGTYYWASSGATLEDAVVDSLLEKIQNDLKNIEKVDGIAIIFHGATVSETREDVCGDVSELIRNIVGEDIPITASFDLHANITEKIAKNVDFICAFQKYPHLDVCETGYRSIKVLGEYFRDNQVKTYYTTVPVIASASGYTTETEALKKLMNLGHEYVKQGLILDFSILQVQPWLDVQEMASSIVVIGKDEAIAKKIAKQLALGEFEIKEKLQGENFLTIEEIIEKARNNKTGKPIIICDSADSPNAGAAGDSAFVLGQLLSVKDEFDMAVSVNDVEAVDKAFELGVGGIGDFTVGGSICPKLSKSVIVRAATVKCLSDGEFVMYGPQERGEKRNIGKCAVIKSGRLNILLAYDGKREGDRNFYRFVGIEPELMDIVDIKACTSFKAGYESISAEICNAETPGAASPVLKLLPYEKRPKPLYPFEDISIEMVKEPKRYR